MLVTTTVSLVCYIAPVRVDEVLFTIAGQVNAKFRQYVSPAARINFTGGGYFARQQRSLCGRNVSDDRRTDKRRHRQPVRTLRSSTGVLLVIPFVRSDFASDAFSVSSPTLWNNLPQDVRSCANRSTFKSRLKSHLFSLAAPSSHSMRLRPDSF